MNPANIATRRCKVSRILEELWWKGPTFLMDTYDKWPSQEFRNSVKESCTELVEVTSVLSVVEEQLCGIGNVIDVNRFNSLDKLLRVTSYVNRFIFNLKRKVAKTKEYKKGYLTLDEIEASEKL